MVQETLSMPMITIQCSKNLEVYTEPILFSNRKGPAEKQEGCYKSPIPTLNHSYK
jgi:hypothetical protein